MYNNSTSLDSAVFSMIASTIFFVIVIVTSKNVTDSASYSLCNVSLTLNLFSSSLMWVTNVNLFYYNKTVLTSIFHYRDVMFYLIKYACVKTSISTMIILSLVSERHAMHSTWKICFSYYFFLRELLSLFTFNHLVSLSSF